MSDKAYIGVDGIAQKAIKGYIGEHTDRIKHYAILESITTPGTAGLDTGVFAKSGLNITVDFQLGKVGVPLQSTLQMLICGGDAWMKNNVGMAFYTFAATEPSIKHMELYVYYENSHEDGFVGYYVDSPLLRHLYGLHGNKLYVDGVLAFEAPTNGTFESSATMGLFCQLFPTSNNGIYCTGVFYACQIKDGEEVVADIVPAKRADGVVGAYDRITGTFLKKKGTGVFEAGAETGEYIYKDIGYSAARSIKKIYDGDDNGTARLLWEA